MCHSILKWFPSSAAAKQVLNMELPELLQDVIRCDLCDTPVPSRHCDVCHIHLCEECEEKHLSDESKEHVIVSFEMRGSTPKCSKHSNETCVRYCKTCNTSICALCDSLGRHKRHKTEHISKMSHLKKEPKRDESQTTVKLRCSSQIREPYVSSGKQKQRVGYKTEVTSTLSDDQRDPMENELNILLIILILPLVASSAFLMGILSLIL